MFGSEGAQRAAAAGRTRPGPRGTALTPLTGTPRSHRHDPAPGGKAARRFHRAQPAEQHSSPAAGHTHPAARHISRSPRPGTLTAGRRPSERRSHSLAVSRRLKGATREERLAQRRERQAPPTRQNNQSAPSPGAQRPGDWRERPPCGQRPLPAVRPPAAGATHRCCGPGREGAGAAGVPGLGAAARVRTSRGAPLRATRYRWASRSRCCGSLTPQRRFLRASAASPSAGAAGNGRGSGAGARAGPGAGRVSAGD